MSIDSNDGKRYAGFYIEAICQKVKKYTKNACFKAFWGHWTDEKGMVGSKANLNDTAAISVDKLYTGFDFEVPAHLQAE